MGRVDTGSDATARRLMQSAGRAASVRAGRGFDGVLDAITSLLMAALLVLAIVQVVLRYVFDSPLAWAQPGMRWLLLWLVFVGGAVAIRHGDEIRIDALVQVLPYAASRVTEVLAAALTGMSLGALVTHGYVHAQQTATIDPTFGVGLTYAYLAVPVGAALMLVNVLRRAIPGVRRQVSALAVLAGAVASLPLGLSEWELLRDVNVTGAVIVITLLLMTLGVSIAHSLILGAFSVFWISGDPATVVVSRLITMVFDNFTLVAIAFFLFMGALMNIGGVTSAIVGAAATMVGHWRGGLAQTNVLASTLMGGLTGSSSADTASVTKTLVPEMERYGYSRAYSCAITAASAIIPNLIPPSIMLILYASIARVSVGSLFMAGVVPGLLLAVGLMGTVWLTARWGRHKTLPLERRGARERGRSLLVASPGLILPVLILGALRFGVVTPTEAGSLAALYALLVGVLVYRKVTPRKLSESVRESGQQTGSVLMLVACSAPVAWLFTTDGVPQALAGALGGLAERPILFMLLLLALLLLAGLPLEAAPAMVILVPVLLPATAMAGVDPVHLGVVMVIGLMIGSLTPPVGALAFISASIADARIFDVFRALTVFEIALVVVLLVIALAPGLALWLPELLGYVPR